MSTHRERLEDEPSGAINTCTSVAVNVDDIEDGPIGGGDTSESKRPRDVSGRRHRHSGRDIRMVWIGILILLVAIVVLAVVLPLALNKGQSGDGGDSGAPAVGWDASASSSTSTGAGVDFGKVTTIESDPKLDDTVSGINGTGTGRDDFDTGLGAAGGAEAGADSGSNTTMGPNEAIPVTEESADAHDNTTAAPGLDPAAMEELVDIGLFKYIGRFAPSSTMTYGPRNSNTALHTFNNDGDNRGPMCIGGTPFSLLTVDNTHKDPSRLLIFLQGGGACWQDFYTCSFRAEDWVPDRDEVNAGPDPGIWDSTNPDNPFRDYSIVYMPYCDGSAWLGDNDVADPSFPANSKKRYHRGMRNLSAGMDLAKARFPNATHIVVAGTSAGGIGAAIFAPFFVRRLYGNSVDLAIFNDAGPVVENLGAASDLKARAVDWGIESLVPPSCGDGCNLSGRQQAGISYIQWRLRHDSTVRDAVYQSDGDLVSRFYMRLVMDPRGFKDLMITEHCRVNKRHPDRYKMYMPRGDIGHGSLQDDKFYYAKEAGGMTLRDWTVAFLEYSPSWVSTVEQE